MSMFFAFESLSFFIYLALAMAVFLGTHALEDIFDKYAFPSEITHLHAHCKVALYLIGYSFIFMIVCNYLAVDLTYVFVTIVILGGVCIYLAKDLLVNFIAGILLLFTKPFKQSDVITVGDVTGPVTSIDLCYVTLDSEGKSLCIPCGNFLRESFSIDSVKKTPRLTRKKAVKKT